VLLPRNGASPADLPHFKRRSRTVFYSPDIRPRFRRTFAPFAPFVVTPHAASAAVQNRPETHSRLKSIFCDCSKPSRSVEAAFSQPPDTYHSDNHPFSSPKKLFDPVTKRPAHFSRMCPSATNLPGLGTTARHDGEAEELKPDPRSPKKPSPPITTQPGRGGVPGTRNSAAPCDRSLIADHTSLFELRTRRSQRDGGGHRNGCPPESRWHHKNRKETSYEKHST
jgi:hypothetical protein